MRRAIVQIVAHGRVTICYNMRQTIQDFAFYASFWLSVKCRSFNQKVPLRSGECAHVGASSFRGSFWASYSLTGTAAGDCALFLLPRMNGRRARRREIGGYLDKKRCSRVNKLGHDLLQFSLANTERVAPSACSAIQTRVKKG